MPVNIIDVGTGNIKSVEYWLDRSNLPHKRVSNIRGLTEDTIIIPGVSSAGEYMQELRHSGLDKEIIARAKQGQKIIGICLGFQLLTHYSEEDGGVDCLGILNGSAKYLDGRKAHNGWTPFFLDSRHLSTNKHLEKKRKKIVNGRVYFNHELRVDLDSGAYISKLDDGIVSFAIQDNVFGFQFHPEKSQVTGQEILELII